MDTEERSPNKMRADTFAHVDRWIVAVNHFFTQMGWGRFFLDCDRDIKFLPENVPTSDLSRKVFEELKELLIYSNDDAWGIFEQGTAMAMDPTHDEVAGIFWHIAIHFLHPESEKYLENGPWSFGYALGIIATGQGLNVENYDDYQMRLGVLSEISEEAQEILIALEATSKVWF
jgi:hypothetical protein